MLPNGQRHQSTKNKEVKSEYKSNYELPEKKLFLTLYSQEEIVILSGILFAFFHSLFLTKLYCVDGP